MSKENIICFTLLLSALVAPKYLIPCNSIEYNPAHITSYNLEISKLRSDVDNLKLSLKTDRTRFNRLDLRTPCNYSGEELNSVLTNTNIAGLGATFAEAEKIYKVNALFLIAMAMQESGGGSSTEARLCNNLFGFESYDNEPSNAAHFNSYSDCILSVASYMSKNYLDATGQYFSGYKPSDVNFSYCTDKEWASGIESIMFDLSNKIQANEKNLGVKS